LHQNAGMTLSVRLPPELEQALNEYCVAHDLKKRFVVQEALTRFLAKPPSSTYLAFKRIGLLGRFRGDGVSATKEVVRQRVLAHHQEKARRNAE
jgi:predicted DNA-binding protein